MASSDRPAVWRWRSGSADGVTLSEGEGQGRTRAEPPLCVDFGSRPITMLAVRSYSASVSGLMWRACVVVLCGGFESGREPCVAVEEVAEGVELADAPFGGGG